MLSPYMWYDVIIANAAKQLLNAEINPKRSMDQVFFSAVESYLAFIVKTVGIKEETEYQIKYCQWAQTIKRARGIFMEATVKIIVVNL